MTGTAREEAERLVATVLAMASQAGSKLGDALQDPSSDAPRSSDTPRSSDASPSGDASRSGGSGLGDLLNGVVGSVLSGGQQHKGTGWATGSAECCVCPVCRTMAAVRDPNPVTAARLAAGAGDFATGVASLMRAFSAVTEGTKRAPEPKTRPVPTPDQSWAAATRATATSPEADEPTAEESADPWTAATREDNRTTRQEAAAQRAAAQRAAAQKAASAREETAGKAAPRAEGEGWAASVRTGKEREEAGKGVTRPTDPWAAAVANYANGVSPRETGVARTGGVDHDVAAQGTPAVAGDRDDRPGGDAPGGAE